MAAGLVHTPYAAGASPLPYEVAPVVSQIGRENKCSADLPCSLYYPIGCVTSHTSVSPASLMGMNTGVSRRPSDGLLGE